MTPAASQPRSCPDEETLSQLIQGRLAQPMAHEHEQHLAHCALCLNRVDTLTASDDLVEALRQTARSDDTPITGEPSRDEGRMVEELMERLHGLADGAAVGKRITDDELRALLAPAESDDELGRLGNHRILSVLGVGGMGIVFKAEDLELGRTVAMKVMKGPLAASRQACQRFQRETRAAAAFEHAHVVTIYHIGESRGVPFFTMEFLEGESLRQKLEHEGPLETAEILRIGREIAQGLAAAHARGLLHRDIKPDNVWVLPDGQIKIVDFGLARTVDQMSSVTGDGVIVGTPVYMAPEQAQGGVVDERCDLFSLGSLLYHLATGSPPFVADNLVATLVAVAQREVAPPLDLNPDLSRDVSDLIVALLAKKAEDRIQSATELVERIECIERGDRPAVHHRSAGPNRSAGWWVAAAVALAVAAFAVIYVMTDRGTLVIDADESVRVAVEGGRVTIRDAVTGRQYEVAIGEQKSVRTGDYEIVATDSMSGLTFSASEFGILRGREKEIRVWIEKPGGDKNGGGRSVPGVGTASGEPSYRPPWLAESSASLDIEPGAPLSGQALVQRPTVLPAASSWTVETRGHLSAVRAAAYSRDGRLATVADDGTLRIWSAHDNELAMVAVGPGDANDVAWASDGEMLATAHGQSICIWELADAGITLRRKILRVTARMAWSPDGRYLAFEDRGVHFWDVASGEMLADWDVEGSIARYCWSSDGQLVATTTESGVNLYNIRDRRLVKSLNSPGATHAIWSRRGRYVACIRQPPSPPNRGGGHAPIGTRFRRDLGRNQSAANS